jgi:hypothetical protein
LSQRRSAGKKHGYRRTVFHFRLPRLPEKPGSNGPSNLSGAPDLRFLLPVACRPFGLQVPIRTLSRTISASCQSPHPFGCDSCALPGDWPTELPLGAGGSALRLCLPRPFGPGSSWLRILWFGLAASLRSAPSEPGAVSLLLTRPFR